VAAEREASILPLGGNGDEPDLPIVVTCICIRLANPKAEKDYLDWIMSPEAQQIVEELGFVPIITP